MSNPIYQTTNQQYQPYWYLNNRQYIDRKEDIPNFRQLNDAYDRIKQTQIQMKKQLRQKIKNEKKTENEKQQNDDNTENNENIKYDIGQKIYDRQDNTKENNDIDVQQDKCDNMQIDNISIQAQNALKIGSPLYETYNMEYGKLRPTQKDMNVSQQQYAKTNKFTEKLRNTFKRNTGLNTVIEKNRVNDKLDVFM